MVIPKGHHVIDKGSTSPSGDYMYIFESSAMPVHCRHLCNKLVLRLTVRSRAALYRRDAFLFISGMGIARVGCG